MQRKNEKPTTNIPVITAAFKEIHNNSIKTLTFQLPSLKEYSARTIGRVLRDLEFETEISDAVEKLVPRSQIDQTKLPLEAYAIRQYLKEALKNSIDANATKLSIIYNTTNNCVHICDNGIGFTEINGHKIEKNMHYDCTTILNMGRSIKSEKKNALGGAGLGLTQLANIIDAHTGNITLKNANNQLSLFNPYHSGATLCITNTAKTMLTAEEFAIVEENASRLLRKPYVMQQVSTENSCNPLSSMPLATEPPADEKKESDNNFTQVVPSFFSGGKGFFLSKQLNNQGSSTSTRCQSPPR